MALNGTDCFITQLCLRPGIVGEERAGTTLARKNTSAEEGITGE